MFRLTDLYEAERYTFTLCIEDNGQAVAAVPLPVTIWEADNNVNNRFHYVSSFSVP